MLDVVAKNTSRIDIMLLRLKLLSCTGETVNTYMLYTSK